VEHGPGANGADANCSPEERAIFTAVVNRAEEHGKTVTPLVVSSNDLLFAIARAAKELDAREGVLGRSAHFPPDLQAEPVALRWGVVEEDESRDMLVRVVNEREVLRFAL